MLYMNDTNLKIRKNYSIISVDNLNIEKYNIIS